MITEIKLDLYAIMIYHSENFELNECSPSKVIEGNQYLPYVLPQQQKTKSKKAHNLAKILWMIINIEFNLYFTMIYPSANFQ